MPMCSYKNIEHTKFNKIKFNKETKKPVVEKSTTGCNSITYANFSIKHG